MDLKGIYQYTIQHEELGEVIEMWYEGFVSFVDEEGLVQYHEDRDAPEGPDYFTKSYRHGCNLIMESDCLNVPNALMIFPLNTIDVTYGKERER